MTDTFDAWMAELDTRRLADMGETERAETTRFLERRGFTVLPEAACHFCGLGGAVLRNRNGVPGHWHCPHRDSQAGLRRLADLLDGLRPDHEETSG